MNCLQAAQPQVQPLDLTIDQQPFLLRQLIDLAARNQLFKPIELADPGRNRVPVRQRTSQPALGNVRHPAAHRLILDRFLCLALRPDEKNVLTALNGIADERVRRIDTFRRLL